jgi:hypothetical protein
MSKKNISTGKIGLFYKMRLKPPYENQLCVEAKAFNEN